MSAQGRRTAHRCVQLDLTSTIAMDSFAQPCLVCRDFWRSTGYRRLRWKDGCVPTGACRASKVETLFQQSSRRCAVLHRYKAIHHPLDGRWLLFSLAAQPKVKDICMCRHQIRPRFSPVERLETQPLVPPPSRSQQVKCSKSSSLKSTGSLSRRIICATRECSSA